MRAVIDTNILVRALIKPQGTVGPVLRHLRDKDFVLLYSEELLAELIDVLNRPRIRSKYLLSNEDLAAVLALILLRGEAIVPEEDISICRDPKDDKILEAAFAGKADFIVSGDDDLLVLNPFRGIPIIGPSEFLAALSNI